MIYRLFCSHLNSLHLFIFQLNLYEAGNPEISNEMLNDEAEKEAEKTRLLKVSKSQKQFFLETPLPKKANVIFDKILP